MATGKQRRAYDSKQYKQNRARLLAGNPLCHWCGTAPATQADHLLELDNGGDNSAENLVPSCAHCNAARGNRHRRQKERTGQTRFLHETEQPRAHSRLLSLEEQHELAGTDADPGGPVDIGREQPRLATVGLGGKSLGPQVAAWAERNLHVSLMPWQKLALDSQLMLDDDDQFVFSASLTTCARQQGKSVALTALIGWALTDYAAALGRPVHVLSAANRLDRAEAIFTSLQPILEAHDAKLTHSFGRKSARMLDGSTWDVRAATARLVGGSYDLVIVDELFDVSQAALEEAIRPTMIARPNPHLSMWSTAGDQSSTAMINIREQCLAEIDAGIRGETCLLEWSIPNSADPRDERWWRWANPALGTTIKLKALRSRAKQESFVRQHLNMWVTARGAMLDPGVWDSHQIDGTLPPGGILAVDSSIDGARYVGVRAVNVGRAVHVDVEFVATDEDAMWEHIDRVMEDKTVHLAITPTLELHLPSRYQRRFSLVGYQELLKYTVLIRSMIVEGRVKHYGSRALSEHMNRAVAAKTSKGLVLSSQKSPGPIEIARCAVWAIALMSRPQNDKKPLLVITG